MSKTIRSGVAMAALGRKPSTMKHRNQPRGGARNEFLEYLEEYEQATEEEFPTFHMEE